MWTLRRLPLFLQQLVDRYLMFIVSKVVTLYFLNCFDNLWLGFSCRFTTTIHFLQPLIPQSYIMI